MKRNKTNLQEQVSNQKRIRKCWLWPVLSSITLLMISGVITVQGARTAPEQARHQTPDSTTDSCLQCTVDSLLRHQMGDIRATTGQVIVMEVATGEIRALVQLQAKPDGSFEALPHFDFRQESGLARIVSALALLDDSKASLDEQVYTGDGLYKYEGHLFIDNVPYRGINGMLTMEKVMLYGSNVGMAKLVAEAYGGQPQSFYDKRYEMNFGQPDTLQEIPHLRPIQYTSPQSPLWEPYCLASNAIGYELKITPLQMLTFFNAIANDGKMMKPLLRRTSPVVINPHIAQTESIRQIQGVLQRYVENGIGKKAGTPSVKVAGCAGTAQVALKIDEQKENYLFEYHVEFCGYFPVQHPKYSIIVSMNKDERPASGSSQAAPVFRQIVEYLMQH